MKTVFLYVALIDETSNIDSSCYILSIDSRGWNLSSPTPNKEQCNLAEPNDVYWQGCIKKYFK